MACWYLNLCINLLVGGLFYWAERRRSVSESGWSRLCRNLYVHMKMPSRSRSKASALCLVEEPETMISSLYVETYPWSTRWGKVRPRLIGSKLNGPQWFTVSPDPSWIRVKGTVQHLRGTKKGATRENILMMMSRSRVFLQVHHAIISWDFSNCCRRCI